MNYFKTINTIFLSAIVALAVVILPACDEEDDHHGEDTEAPQFTITAPTAMQVFMNGDTVFMKGTVTDNLSMHELDIVIKNTATDDTLYSKVQSVHDLTSYDMDFFWKSSVTDHTNAIVIFRAEDHGENVTADTVHIHIMP